MSQDTKTMTIDEAYDLFYKNDTIEIEEDLSLDPETIDLNISNTPTIT